MNEVWVCVYKHRQVSILDLCSIVQVVDSREKADKWLDKYNRHEGADQRFWIAEIMRFPIR